MSGNIVLTSLPLLVATAVLCGLSYVTMQKFGGFVTGQEEWSDRRRRAVIDGVLTVGRLLGWPLSVLTLVVASAPVLQIVLGVAEPWGMASQLPTGLFIWGLVLSLTLLVDFFAYKGIQPYRDLSVGLDTPAWYAWLLQIRRGVLMGLFIAVLLGYFYALLVALARTRQWAVAALIVAVWSVLGLIVALFVQPLAIRMRFRSGPTGDDFAETTSALLERHGVDVQNVWRIDRPSKGTWVRVLGIWRTKQLFVTPEVEDCPASIRSALLLTEVGLRRHRFRRYRIFVTPALLLLYVTVNRAVASVLGAPVPLSNGVGPYLLSGSLLPELGLVAAYLLAALYGRKLVYRADRFVAANTSPSAVTRALDARLSSNEEFLADRRALSFLFMQPSVRERIDRLNDGDGAGNE